MSNVRSGDGYFLTQGGPFDLDDADSYARWRDAKLDGYPASTGELVVEVRSPAAINDAEFAEMMARARKANMVLYATTGGSAQSGPVGKETIRAVGACFGLHNLDSNLHADDDGITPLHVAAAGETGRLRYIPYSDRPIKWHTDGYYNLLDRQIHGLLLHCVCDSMEGGANQLLDHEILYIQIREKNPDYIRALMHPEAMTIPENIEDGRKIRGDRSGPVFMRHPGTGALHMRYTMRKRNIVWRDDPVLNEATACLESLLTGDNPYVFRHRMAPGQGLVSNNVLHDRQGFADSADAGKVRLIFRARYFDRIAGTGQ